MEKYSEYKDSGIQWLGEIPSHWKLMKSKYLWKETNENSHSGKEDLLSVSQYTGVTKSQSDSRSESLKGYKIVHENELVINIMLAWLGGLGVSDYEGIVSPAYCTYKLQKDYSPKFLHYLYKTPMYLAEFARHSTGVVPSRWRMYTDDFGQVVSLLPPKDEQEAIVRYLDAATSKIDKAIAMQQKMIDLLNERKQIIIQKAVTKGLEENVDMKNSGVEWIGMIPKHWNKDKAMRLFGLYGSGTTPKNNEGNGNIPWVNSGDLNNSELYSVNKYVTEKLVLDIPALKIYSENSIIIAMYGASIGKISISKMKCCTNQACFVLSFPKRKMKLTYAFYSLMACKKHWIENSQGGTQPNINADIIKQTWLALPPLNEQKIIVEYITKKCYDITNAIERCQRQISLLQERKQIIINEVVTGKVKVS